MTGQSKIRVGLVGVGNWGLKGHLPVLQLLPDYEVVAVQSRRREAAETAASQFGVPRVKETALELVSDPDIDLVSVLTTAPQHEEGVRAAIAAGKHVYSEWPLSTSTAASVDLLNVAEGAGVRHFVGLQRRLSATSRYLHDGSMQTSGVCSGLDRF